MRFSAYAGLAASVLLLLAACSTGRPIVQENEGAIARIGDLELSRDELERNKAIVISTMDYMRSEATKPDAPEYAGYLLAHLGVMEKAGVETVAVAGFVAEAAIYQRALADGLGPSEQEVQAYLDKVRSLVGSAPQPALPTPYHELTPEKARRAVAEQKLRQALRDRLDHVGPVAYAVAWDDFLLPILHDVEIRVLRPDLLAPATAQSARIYLINMLRLDRTWGEAARAQEELTTTPIPPRNAPGQGGQETPTPAASPRPTTEPGRSFLTPSPTRLPLAGLKTVEYDPAYRASDLSEGKFAAIGPDSEVYLIDIETGRREQATNDGYRKRDAVVSGQYVAWIDERRKIPIHDSALRPPEGVAGDIFLLNLATREIKRITDVPARRAGLRMSGNRLVWMDNRNELGEHYTHTDIYSYDIATGKEQPVVVARGAQRNPSIHGDLVVWEDNRNSPELGTVKAGCGNCPENRFDIYLYDFSTGRERPLVESAFLKEQPSIYKERVAWQDFRNGRKSDIYLLDISTGKERRLTDGDRASLMPSIWGDNVLWHRMSACDVFPQAPGTGIFVYNLASGQVRQLSNYVEPNARIHGNVVLITEGCFAPQRIYSVFLDGAAPIPSPTPTVAPTPSPTPTSARKVFITSDIWLEYDGNLAGLYNLNGEIKLLGDGSVNYCQFQSQDARGRLEAVLADPAAMPAHPGAARVLGARGQAHVPPVGLRN